MKVKKKNDQELTLKNLQLQETKVKADRELALKILESQEADEQRAEAEKQKRSRDIKVR